MPPGSGPISVEWSRDVSPGLFSLRTPLALTCFRSSGDLPAWGSMLRGGVSVRLSAEPHIDAKGCSYWPTPTASTYGYNLGGAAGRVGKKRQSLRGIVGGPESPEWLEWMMGLPIGQTALEPLGTRWSRWWRLMRSELSRPG